MGVLYFYEFKIISMMSIFLISLFILQIIIFVSINAILLRINKLENDYDNMESYLRWESTYFLKKD